MLHFGYKSKKNPDIYDIRWAMKGLCLSHPENTLAAYQRAIDANLGIGLDVRMLKDETLVCFGDRYTKRLLGEAGVITHFSYSHVKKNHILKSEETVPELNEALMMINKNAPVLFLIHGTLTKKYKANMIPILKNYIARNEGTVFFQVRNLYNYFVLKKYFGNTVFYEYNFLRRNLNFIKESYYMKEVEQLHRYVSNGIKEEYMRKTAISISKEDIAAAMVNAMEESKTVQEAITAIAGVTNTYTSKITPDHWLLTWLKVHRGIISKSQGNLEHSRESIQACIAFADQYQIPILIEVDVMKYSGKVICYHEDKNSDRLGQPTACVAKIPIAEAMEFEELIQLITGHEQMVGLIIDIKDYHYKDMSLSTYLAELLHDYTGNFTVQSFNPFVVRWFRIHEPDFIRGQIGNSLPGLMHRHVPASFPWAVNFFLFDIGESDYCLYDMNNFIYVFTKYCKGIKGKVVLGYAPINEEETKIVGGMNFDDYIIEDAANPSSWSHEFLQKYQQK